MKRSKPEGDRYYPGIQLDADRAEMIKDFRLASIVYGVSEGDLIVEFMNRWLLEHGGMGKFQGLLISGEFRGYIFEHLGLDVPWGVVMHWINSGKLRHGFEYFRSTDQGGGSHYCFDIRRCWNFVCDYAEGKGVKVSDGLRRLPVKEYGALGLGKNQLRYRDLSGDRVGVDEGEEIEHESPDPVTVVAQGGIEHGWDTDRYQKRR